MLSFRNCNIVSMVTAQSVYITAQCFSRITPGTDLVKLSACCAGHRAMAPGGRRSRSKAPSVAESQASGSDMPASGCEFNAELCLGLIGRRVSTKQAMVKFGSILCHMVGNVGLKPRIFSKLMFIPHHWCFRFLMIHHPSRHFISHDKSDAQLD